MLNEYLKYHEAKINIAEISVTHAIYRSSAAFENTRTKQNREFSDIILSNNPNNVQQAARNCSKTLCARIESQISTNCFHSDEK